VQRRNSKISPFPAWNIAVAPSIHTALLLYINHDIFLIMEHLRKIHEISQEILSSSRLLQKNLPLDHGIIRSCRQPGQEVRCVQEPAQEVLPGLRPRSLLPGLGSPQIRVRAEDLWSQQHCKSAPGKSITHLLILLTASLLVRHTTRQCTPISGLFLTSSKSIEH
jgi:hypothetical protein